MVRRFKKGFTLAELLTVVAIIAVLVAIAIPVFSSQLEKSRETVDLANIRSAYAQIMIGAITDGRPQTSDPIQLKQQTDDWQYTAGKDALYTLFSAVTGTPSGNGKAWVDWEDGSVMLRFLTPVPGDKAALDALNFPEGSDERVILTSLPTAERQALQLYEAENTNKVIGYLVTLNADGTFTMSPRKDTQVFHERNPSTIMNNGYMVAVKDGKVGSNLKYDPSSNTLKSTPYHIRNDRWNNYAEGINFDY